MFENEFVIVRCNLAGSFAGILTSIDEHEVVLREARRLWQWSGANCLSDLATRGVRQPNLCKISAPVTVRLRRADADEIIAATEIARVSIAAVPEWVA